MVAYFFLQFFLGHRFVMLGIPIIQLLASPQTDPGTVTPENVDKLCDVWKACGEERLPICNYSSRVYRAHTFGKIPCWADKKEIPLWLVGKSVGVSSKCVGTSLDRRFWIPPIIDGWNSAQRQEMSETSCHDKLLMNWSRIILFNTLGLVSQLLCVIVILWQVYLRYFFTFPPSLKQKKCFHKISHHL